jgi:DNA-binding transcriptional ArsR family regulator
MDAHHPTHLTNDVAFDLMRDTHRRAIVRVLAEDTSRMDLHPLAQAVTEMIADQSGATESSAERVSISLFHQHLPKLEAAGVIDFDAEARTVTPTEAMADLVRLT